ncbi:MAG: hypothetical protein D3926_24535 [Desulfobacteraceae bacterium]|nr:MAG: hypothetical protein D3926_24535 [Desulfobacteraceae bacterium]
MTSALSQSMVNRVELKNGHTLIIEDLSRQIGEDAFVVILRASISIDVTNAIFSPDSLKGLSIDDIIKTLGDTVEYEYRVERNMIMDHEKDQVFKDLKDTFIKNLHAYLEKDVFPERLVLKQYRDACK